MKSSEVAGTFLEIGVMTRQKSYAFDSEKVAGIEGGSELNFRGPG